MSPSPASSVQAALVTVSARHARTLRSRAGWVAVVVFDMLTQIVQEWGGWLVWVLSVCVVLLVLSIVEDLRRAHLIMRTIEDMAASR